MHAGLARTERRTVQNAGRCTKSGAGRGVGEVRDAARPAETHRAIEHPHGYFADLVGLAAVAADGPGSDLYKLRRVDGAAITAAAW